MKHRHTLKPLGTINAFTATINGIPSSMPTQLEIWKKQARCTKNEIKGTHQKCKYTWACVSMQDVIQAISSLVFPLKQSYLSRSSERQGETLIHDTRNLTFNLEMSLETPNLTCEGQHSPRNEHMAPNHRSRNHSTGPNCAWS